jgi:hypothetical protein
MRNRLLHPVLPLAISGILAITYAIVSHAGEVSASQGVNVGEMSFSWGQLLVFVGLGIAWGDMRRGQQDLAKELALFMAAQNQRIAKIEEKVGL